MIVSATSIATKGRGRSALAILVAVSRVVLVGALAAYTGLLMIAVLPAALGLRSTVVLTGSMRPGIQPGDVVLSSQVPTAMLRPGHILLVDDPAHAGEYLMHRYHHTAPDGSIITRGDANRSEDSTPVPVRNVRGIPRIRVPAVGLPLVWLRLGAPAGVRYAGAALLALLVLALIPRRRRVRPARAATAHASCASASGSGSGSARVRRRRTVAAAALAVVTAVASQVTTPGAHAAFTAAADNGSTYTAASSFYSSTILDDSPAGYWRGSGLNDLVTGTPASYTGTVTPVAGVTPDGDVAVYLPSPGTVRLPKTMENDLTVEFWFRTAAGAGGIGPFYSGAPLLHSSIESGNGNVGISVTADGHLLAGTGSTTMGTEVTVVSAAGGYADDAWHHVAFARTAASGLMRLYVDGALSGTATGGTQPLNSRNFFYLGVNRDLHRYSGGTYDEFAVFSAPLSAAQIAAHFAARGTGYAAAVAADVPAGYWPLDDASGDTVAATVGGAGTYLGVVNRSIAPAIATGVGIGLDTVGGYATIPRLIADDFSLEFWFKSSGGANYGQWWNTAGLVDADVVGSQSNDFGVGLSETGRVVAGVGNPDTSIQSGTGYNDGGWHHVVLTRTKATGAIQLYVDGAQAATNPGTGNTNALDGAPSFTIGKGTATPGDPAPASNAAIDEIAQYTYVLTPAQIANHYAQVTG